MALNLIRFTFILIILTSLFLTHVVDGQQKQENINPPLGQVVGGVENMVQLLLGSIGSFNKAGTT